MVRCPTCGAAPGTSCKSSDGSPHKKRSLLNPAKRRGLKPAGPDPVTRGLGSEEANAVDSVSCPKCGAVRGELCSGNSTHPGRLGAYGRAMDLARMKSRGKVAPSTSRSARTAKPKAKKRKKSAPSTTLKVQPYQASKTSNSKNKRLKANPRTSPRSSVKLWTGKR